MNTNALSYRCTQDGAVPGITTQPSLWEQSLKCDGVGGNREDRWKGLGIRKPYIPVWKHKIVGGWKVLKKQQQKKGNVRGYEGNGELMKDIKGEVASREWRRQERGTRCAVAPTQRCLSSIWRCVFGVCVCAELSEGHDVCAAVCMYERRCGKPTVSCECLVCVFFFFFFLLRGFAGACNRDLVLMEFRMMTLPPPCPQVHAKKYVKMQCTIRALKTIQN